MSQKIGGKVAGYARYTAREAKIGALNVFSGGTKALDQFAKNPNRSFKNGMKIFNKGWKTAINPRKTLGKAAKATKKTGTKVLKTLKKFDTTTW